MFSAQVIIPVSICVVLPVLIVWIIYHSINNRNNKNTEILIKALETNPNIDVDRLIETMSRSKKTAMDTLHTRLLRGCIFSSLGVAVSIMAGIFAYTDPESHAQNPCLIISGVSLAIGIAYLVVYFVTKKTVTDNSNRQ